MSDGNCDVGCGEVIDLLENADGLDIESISDELGIDYQKAKESVHGLWEDNLVVMGPGFEFESDRQTPPNLGDCEQ